ncbi:MAG TPA: hypothetical protein VKJ77_02660 [Caballeronia sp.]|nr:hypothetical protein [Caballeronia sp.]
MGPVFQFDFETGLDGDAHTEVAVRMYLCEGTDIPAGMNVDAALHLLRLLERYNWTLSDGGHYADRWRKFWPVITDVERALLTQVVRVHCRGRFAQPFQIGALPPSMQHAAGDRSLVKMTEQIEIEFHLLLYIGYSVLLTTGPDKPDNLRAMWSARLATCPDVREGLLLAAVDEWVTGHVRIGGQHCFDLGVLLKTRLLEAGVDAQRATMLSSRFAGDVFDCIQTQQDKRFEFSAHER